MQVSVFFTFWGLFALVKPERRRKTGKDWMTKALGVTFGPDGKLYGGTLDGKIYRFALDAVGGFHPQFLRYSYLEDLELPAPELGTA